MANGEETQAPNGWNKWSKYVLEELKRQNITLKDIQADIRELEKAFVRLETNFEARGRTLGSVWGLLSGIAGALIVLAVKKFWP